jgi:hypothetical protein
MPRNASKVLTNFVCTLRLTRLRADSVRSYRSKSQHNFLVFEGPLRNQRPFLYYLPSMFDSWEVQVLFTTSRNIYVRSRRAGERVMRSVTRLLTTRLELRWSGNSGARNHGG